MRGVIYMMGINGYGCQTMIVEDAEWQMRILMLFV